jgi:methylated-DNA-[protein]-cysteine S-methyltransferase
MAVKRRAYYRSPIGTLEIVGSQEGLTAVSFVRRRPVGGPPDSALREAVEQLDEYFRGRRKEFSLRLCLVGTDFQKRAWEELIRIPYGQTSSYGRVAKNLGKPLAVRAVGQANHRNPISIIVPCHRVLGGDGGLVGYGGGLWRKEWLLAHETKHARKGREKSSGKEGRR